MLNPLNLAECELRAVVMSNLVAIERGQYEKFLMQAASEFVDEFKGQLALS